MPGVGGVAAAVALACLSLGATPTAPTGFAVRFAGSDHHTKATQLAQDLGLLNHGQVGMLEGVYRFHHNPDVNASHARHRRGSTSLDTASDPTGAQQPVQVTHAEVLGHALVHNAWPLVPKRRVRRTLHPSDPFFKDQWYFAWDEPYGLETQVAWDAGLNGSGVVVSVVDDGIEHDHPDLRANYDPYASHNFNPRQARDPFQGPANDPYPDVSNSINRHGTRCSGAVAAGASNGVCGAGVAFDAAVGGIRMLDGPVDDAVEAGSLSWNSSHVDIYSCSWGPDDDGQTYDGPGPLTENVLRQGVKEGRHGLGSVFVWAGGNGGHNDHCNCDGYVTSLYTIAINAVNRNGQRPSYTEQCASIFVSVTPGTVTTDMRHECTETFSGTSAAAPIAAGGLAIVLQANPCLTWRDVQHVIARAATPHGAPTIRGATDAHINGAGFSHSESFGFGVLNVSRATELAVGWVPVGGHVQLAIGPSAPPPSDFRSITLDITASGCDSHGGSVCIERLEHVQFQLRASMTLPRGQVTIRIVSPSGTTSDVLKPRPNDRKRNIQIDWTFLSVAFWGEPAQGTWRVTVESSDHSGTINLLDWSLIMHGTALYDATDGMAYAPNVSLPNGCSVCPPTTFADGNGQCRPCHPSCKSGCVAPGEMFCTQDTESRVQGHGSYHTYFGQWLVHDMSTAEGIVVLLLVIVFVVALTNVVYRVVSRRYATRVAMDDGAVMLLDVDGEPCAPHDDTYSERGPNWSPGGRSSRTSSTPYIRADSVGSRGTFSDVASGEEMFPAVARSPSRTSPTRASSTRASPTRASPTRASPARVSSTASTPPAFCTTEL
eukprot:m.127373 g.127373  ORF g.127373 m.127373 type:complete len:829 (+) comp11210_c1_seq1:61-2547(+)